MLNAVVMLVQSMEAAEKVLLKEGGEEGQKVVSIVLEMIKDSRRCPLKSAHVHPIIILEGLDGTGKSTILEGLERYYGDIRRLRSPPERLCSFRAHFDHQSPHLRRAFYTLGNYACALSLREVSGKPIAIDRFWPSTVAYALAFDYQAGLFCMRRRRRMIMKMIVKMMMRMRIKIMMMKMIKMTMMTMIMIMMMIIIIIMILFTFESVNFGFSPLPFWRASTMLASTARWCQMTCLRSQKSFCRCRWTCRIWCQAQWLEFSSIFLKRNVWSVCADGPPATWLQKRWSWRRILVFLRGSWRCTVRWRLETILCWRWMLLAAMKKCFNVYMRWSPFSVSSGHRWRQFLSPSQWIGTLPVNATIIVVFASTRRRQVFVFPVQRKASRNPSTACRVCVMLACRSWILVVGNPFFILKPWGNWCGFARRIYTLNPSALYRTEAKSPESGSRSNEFPRKCWFWGGQLRDAESNEYTKLWNQLSLKIYQQICVENFII